MTRDGQSAFENPLEKCCLVCVCTTEIGPWKQSVGDQTAFVVQTQCDGVFPCPMFICCSCTLAACCGMSLWKACLWARIMQLERAVQLQNDTDKAVLKIQASFNYDLPNNHSSRYLYYGAAQARNLRQTRLPRRRSAARRSAHPLPLQRKHCSPSPARHRRCAMFQHGYVPHPLIIIMPQLRTGLWHAHAAACAEPTPRECCARMCLAQAMAGRCILCESARTSAAP